MIQHKVEAEKNQLPPAMKRFTRWQADEALTGLKTTIGYPALLLEIFEVNTKSSNAYDVKGAYRGAFTILDNVKLSDFADEELKADITYGIVEDVLKGIWQDHYGPGHDSCTTPFKKFDFNNLNIVYVGPLFTNEFGWRCEFGFDPHRVLKLF